MIPRRPNRPGHGKWPPIAQAGEPPERQEIIVHGYMGCIGPTILANEEIVSYPEASRLLPSVSTTLSVKPLLSWIKRYSLGWILDESRSPIGKISGLLSRLRRIFCLIRQSAPVWTTIAIIVVVIQGLIPLASVYLLKLIIDTVTYAAAGYAGEGLLRRSLLLVIAVCILAFVRILCSSIETFLRDAQMAVLRDQMLGLMHRKSHEADFGHFENSEYLDRLYRTQEEIGFRPLNILEGLLEIARNGIALLAVAGLVISFHWLFAFLLIASCVPSAHARSKYGKILHDWYIERTQQERLAYYIHWMLCVSTYAKEIRSYLLGDLFERRYQDIRKLLRDERLDIIKRRGIAEFFGSLVPTLTFYITYCFVVYQTIMGRLTIGDMVMFYQAFQLTQEYVQTIMIRVAKLYEDDLFLSSFYDLMDEQTEIMDSPDCVDFPSPIKGGVGFSNVGFAYPGTENCAIERVSLTVKPGMIVGIVGGKRIRKVDFNKTSLSALRALHRCNQHRRYSIESPSC